MNINLCIKLIAVSLSILGLFGCSAEREAEKLGFANVSEMNVIHGKGWHVKSQYDSDMALIAEKKKQREDEIAFDLALAKKMADEKKKQDDEMVYKQALSDGMPLRAEKPIHPLIIKKLPTSLTWLAKLPFGAPSALFNERFKSFCQSGRSCEIPRIQIPTDPCFAGVFVKCISVDLSFSDADQLNYIAATYQNGSDFNFNSLVSNFSNAFGIGEQSDKETHFQGSTMRRKTRSWVFENGSVELEQESGPGFGINDYGKLIFDGTTSVAHKVTITSK